MDTEKSREQLWHRLDNESGRAHEAFKLYMYMNPAERSVARTWRKWTDNPDAARPSPFFEEWAREHAWSERTRAHDHYLELIREEGMAEAIREEARVQAQQVEKIRGRFHELMAMAYERAMQYLESDDFVQKMRPSDVISITKIYFEATRHFGDPLQPHEKMVDLTPDELAELERIVGQVEARDRGRDNESEQGSVNGEEDSEHAEDK